jgi:hypothetical protein
MRYMLTIYGDESVRPTPEQGAAMLAEYGVFTEELHASSVFVAGEGLERTPTATTVRVRDGERVVTDGPFADTKEALAGFYLLECANLDEAIGWAAKIPGAKSGSIEVRPVMNYEAAGQAVEAGAGAQGA